MWSCILKGDYNFTQLHHFHVDVYKQECVISGALLKDLSMTLPCIAQSDSLRGYKEKPSELGK